MPSGQSSCADADSEGFELLTASSGKVSISAAEMNGAGATRDHKQGEIEAITEYLAACKRQIAKEHREKQEAEWQVSCPLHLSCEIFQTSFDCPFYFVYSAAGQQAASRLVLRHVPS